MSKFGEFKVESRGDANMWLIPVWVRLPGKPRNPDWYQKEMLKLEKARCFVEEAIIEKLQRERGQRSS